MRQCPNCFQEILESAVRCRFCRKPVTKLPSRVNIAQKIKKINLFQEKPSSAAFSWVEAILLCGAFFGVLAWIRGQELGYVWVEYLRSKHSFFTREPLLQSYVSIFAETLALKLGLVLMVFGYLLFRGRTVFRALSLYLERRFFLSAHFYIFLGVCALVSYWQGMDPLAPDLLTPLFFSESATIGNLLTFLSLAVVAPFTEEIIFRGVLYPALTGPLTRSGSILATSVLFAAAHAPQMNGAYEHLAVIFIVGFFLSWLRALTGSTLYVAILHSIYNTSLIVGGYIRFSFYGF